MKPLFIGVFPNFEKDDQLLIRKLLFANRTKDYRTDFAKELKIFLKLLPTSNVYLLDSARSSFHLILRSLNITPGSEVIVPSFTCVVIINPILWNNLIPRYVDIDLTSFNTSVENLLANITAKTKVILVQHTFGAVIDIEKLKTGLKKLERTDIILIEDLAHSLGGKYNNNSPDQLLGSAADYAILTFGIEKMISTIRGGAIIANQKNILLETDYLSLKEVNYRYLLKLILNPIFWSIITPIYYLGVKKLSLGKLIVNIAHRIGFLGIAINAEEYYGVKPTFLPVKLAHPLAKLGSTQLQKLTRFNDHRRQIAKLYFDSIQNTQFANNPEQQFISQIFQKDLPHSFIRYPLVLKTFQQRTKLIELAKSHKIVLGDWYKTLLYTKLQYLSKLGYSLGLSPNAEEVAELIINLPTAINVTKEHVILINSLIANL